MSIFIISDLHLEETRPEIVKIFYKFLKEEVSASNALYILGDFFESWIGDDDDSNFHRSIITALRTVSDTGIPIYFMPGNRDFLIGRRFLKAAGCQRLPDEYVMNLHGIPTLMMHGDTLCTQDTKYLKFRRKARNWFFQQLFLLKPLKSRRALAQQYREASQHHVTNLPDYIMDVTPAAVDAVMLKHKVVHLIHGHTHRQNVHQSLLEGKAVTRTVLGAWHDNGNALLCKENGETHFITLPL